MSRIISCILATTKANHKAGRIFTAKPYLHACGSSLLPWDLWQPLSERCTWWSLKKWAKWQSGFKFVLVWIFYFFLAQQNCLFFQWREQNVSPSHCYHVMRTTSSHVCSSGSWRTGWCASASKSVLSNRALKSLAPTLCLAGVMTYALADELRNFVAGVFIPQYHFPYAVALCFAQVGTRRPLFVQPPVYFNNHQKTTTMLTCAHLLWGLDRVLCDMTAGSLSILRLHVPL